MKIRVSKFNCYRSLNTRVWIPSFVSSFVSFRVYYTSENLKTLLLEQGRYVSNKNEKIFVVRVTIVYIFLLNSLCFILHLFIFYLEDDLNFLALLNVIVYLFPFLLMKYDTKYYDRLKLFVLRKFTYRKF